jgi:hypothetical protein
VLALRLNEPEVTQTVYKCIPRGTIELIVAHFPTNYLPKLLNLLTSEISRGRDVEWVNIWLAQVLKYHAASLSEAKGEARSSLLQVCQ